MMITDDDTAFLPLSRQPVEVGQRIAVVGSPMGLEATVSEGIISAIPEERQDLGQIMPATFQITAPISEGSSGSPVVNLKGEVIGVSAAYLKQSENLNFAIPVERILALKEISPVAIDIWSSPGRKRGAGDFFVEGLASTKGGDCDKGLQSFYLALKNRPAFAWAWWGAGVCFMQEGETDKAITSLKQSSALDPSLGPPHYALALTYASQGKQEPAYKEYEVLKGLDPDLAKKLAGQLPK